MSLVIDPAGSAPDDDRAPLPDEPPPDFDPGPDYDRWAEDPPQPPEQDPMPWGQGDAIRPSANGHHEDRAGEPIAPSRFVPGGSWILDEDDQGVALWGSGSEIAWAEGEPLLVTGAIGIGKTTLMQRLALARIGVGPDRLLGYKVEPASGPVLYLASDRPRQVRRSFRRMVEPEDRERLDARLVVWQGPPVADLAKHPETLVKMIRAAGATEVYLDSLKDMALGLSDDDTGAGLNTAIQVAIAEGYQVAGAHHPRKKQQGSARPKDLDDVYGSIWITSGAGSVIHLHGEPGSLVSTLLHLKAPQDPLGPFDLTLDPANGSHSITDEVDLCALASRSDTGITAQTAAVALFGNDPTPGQVEKARRKLKNHPRLEEHEGTSVSGGAAPKYYRPRPEALTQALTQDPAA